MACTCLVNVKARSIAAAVSLPPFHVRTHVQASRTR